MVLKVITKYKEEPTQPRAEDKPKRELTISEWLQEMADEGFDGTFVAHANDGRQYKGDIIKQDGKFVVKSKRIPTPEEVKARMQQLKKS